MLHFAVALILWEKKNNTFSIISRLPPVEIKRMWKVSLCCSLPIQFFLEECMYFLLHSFSLQFLCTEECKLNFFFAIIHILQSNIFRSYKNKYCITITFIQKVALIVCLNVENLFLNQFFFLIVKIISLGYEIALLTYT